MENSNIKRIMQLYIGKHFSLESRVLFGRWLRADEDAAAKIDMLRTIWEETSAEQTAETREDWLVIKKQLNCEPFKRNTHSIYYRLMNYAAVLALMLITAATTYLISGHQFPVSCPTFAEIFVPIGETRNIVLPDGSQVRADAGSLIVYPTDFTDTETRTVYLSGLASFSVQKNEEKPFIVKTAYMETQALGTEFQVSAYPDDNEASVSLLSGSVKVEYSGMDGDVILKPNEQLVYNKNSGAGEVKQFDSDNLTAWQHGELVFSNMTLEDIITVLERKYPYTFIYTSDNLRQDTYSFRFPPNATVENVMKIITQVADMNYKIVGEKCYLRNKRR